MYVINILLSAALGIVLTEPFLAANDASYYLEANFHHFGFKSFLHRII